MINEFLQCLFSVWDPSSSPGFPACDIIFSLQGGMTPLIWAALAGHVECVNVLMGRGAQAHHQDKVREECLFVPLPDEVTIYISEG